MSGISVSKLNLSNFRCYDASRITLGSTTKPVVLTGANGAGKTNILEAISFLSPGRGLRRAALSEVGKIGAVGQWAVAATINCSSGAVDVGTGLAPIEVSGKSNNRRLVRIDGENASGPAAFADLWSVSWLTPQMDRLFLEGASSRRRFLDRMMLGLYPDHARQVSAYERAMRERNRLLMEQGTSADAGWLSALEARMAEHGVAVAAARNAFASHLLGKIEQAPNGRFPKATIALDGFVEQSLLEKSATSVEEELMARLKSSRRIDATKGRSSVGPHMCDLKINHREKDMPAELCSTGEQKALLIGLILANARLTRETKGAAPLLLLDEVVAHLDADRRQALFDELFDLDSQCWLTGTDRSLFDGLEGRANFFTVANATVSNATA